MQCEPAACGDNQCMTQWLPSMAMTTSNDAMCVLSCNVYPIVEKISACICNVYPITEKISAWRKGVYLITAESSVHDVQCVSYRWENLCMTQCVPYRREISAWRNVCPIVEKSVHDAMSTLSQRNQCMTQCVSYRWENQCMTKISVWRNVWCLTH